MTKKTPVCVVLGSIDHGKTTFLDKISLLGETGKEAGSITQKIRSIHITKNIVSKMMNSVSSSFSSFVPIQFIDTPGHASFSRMRELATNYADIAFLIIDINSGIEEETLKCIKLLKKNKKPFIILLSKIDKVEGWSECTENNYLKKFSSDTKFSEKFYELYYKIQEKFLNHFPVPSNLFWNVKNMTKEIIIVPITATENKGIDHAVTFLSGFSKKYIKNFLHDPKSKSPKAYVLNSESGPKGTFIDCLLWGGTLKKGGTYWSHGNDQNIKFRIRSLFHSDNSSSLNTTNLAKALTSVRILCSGGLDIKNIEENCFISENSIEKKRILGCKI